MRKKVISVCIVVIFLIMICTPGLKGTFGGIINTVQGGEHEPITIATGGMNYDAFEKALKKAYPEVELEFISYAGEDSAVYFAESLRAGDAPDIYTSVHMLDEELLEKHLVDLSQYEFVKNYSLSMLEEMGINQNVYMLPANFRLAGIYYNKTLMEEHGWEVPESFDEMKLLVKKIKKAGLRPALVETESADDVFSYIMNISKTVFLHSQKGIKWQEEFLEGEVTAEGYLEESFDYVQQWIDCGLLEVSTGDSSDVDSRYCSDYDKRQEFEKGETVFYFTFDENEIRFTQFADGSGDEYALMPWISQDGQTNLYISCVGRYYGINKKLEEDDNKIKLEDARKVMSFIGTKEGQEALAQGNKEALISSLRDGKVPENNPYYKGEEMLNSGHTVPMTYTGWENSFMRLSEKYLGLMCGETTAKEVITYMDELQKGILEKGSLQVLADVKENLSLEDTGKLVAKSMAETLGADIGIISLGGYHDGMENPRGINGCLYEGTLFSHAVYSILPKTENTQLILFKLKGNVIEELCREGFDLHGNGKTYPYVYYLNGYEKILPDLEYTVVLNSGDYDRCLEEKGSHIESDVWLYQAFSTYLTKEKHVSVELI